MGKVIVIEFVTLDGVVEDPTAAAARPVGGWALHAGREVFAGDKFRLGPIMADGVLLFGRRHLGDVRRPVAGTQRRVPRRHERGRARSW